LAWGEEAVPAKGHSARFFVSPTLGGSHESGQSLLACFAAEGAAPLVIDCEVRDRSERGEHADGEAVVRALASGVARR